MELKFDKRQLAKLLFLLFSLTLIPFVPSSLRAPYIYFLLNSLIIVVGYDSGVLHFLAEPAVEKKKPALTLAPELQSDIYAITHLSKQSVEVSGFEEWPATLEETLVKQEKPLKRSPSIPKVKKNPSVPCLFFIDTCDADVVEEEEEEIELYEAREEISGQELFTRAESFIGNFYKQLKIQREESFKRIHGHYHKPL